MVASSSNIPTDLSSISWNNETIKVRGLDIGKTKPSATWKSSLENLRKRELNITVLFQIWKAKTFLAKAKLFPAYLYS